MPQIHVSLHGEGVLEPDHGGHGAVFQELDLGLFPELDLFVLVQLVPGLFDQAVDALHLAVPGRVNPSVMGEVGVRAVPGDHDGVGVVEAGQVDVHVGPPAGVVDHGVGIVPDQAVVGGMVHHLKLEVDARFFELGLQGHHGLLVARGQLADVHLHREAVLVAGLSQELPGLVQVVLVDHAGLHGPVLGQSARGRRGQGRGIDGNGQAFSHERGHALAGNGIGEGLADSEVVKGFAAHVVVEHLGFTGAEGGNLDIVEGGDLLHPLGLVHALDDVHFPRAQPELTGADIGHVVDVDLLQVRRAPEVLLMSGQNDLFPGGVLFEHERPGSHRVDPEPVVALFFYGLFADDEPAGIVGELGQKQNF